MAGDELRKLSFAPWTLRSNERDFGWEATQGDCHPTRVEPEVKSRWAGRERGWRQENPKGRKPGGATKSRGGGSCSGRSASGL